MSAKQAPPRSAEQERDRNAKKIVMYNRRARFEYEILESYEAGMVLVGTEVKSLRNARVNIQDAFCRIERGELWLYNMHITPYELGNRYNVEPLRKRKLLLHAWQIREMQTEVEQKGLTVIPLSLFFSGGSPSWRSPSGAAKSCTTSGKASRSEISSGKRGGNWQNTDFDICCGKKEQNRTCLRQVTRKSR